MSNGLLRRIARASPLGFLVKEDEEERKRRERFQASVSRLFGRTVGATVEQIPQPVRQTGLEFSAEIQKRIPKRTEEATRSLMETVTEPWREQPTLTPQSFLKETSRPARGMLNVAAIPFAAFEDAVVGLAEKTPLKKVKKKIPGTEYEIKATEALGLALTLGVPLPGGKLRKAKEAAKVVNTFDDAARVIASKVRTETPKKNFLPDFVGFTKNLKEKLMDSFSPVADAINLAEKKGKFKLLVEKDPRFLRDRVLGANDIAAQSLKRDLEPILKRIGAKNIDEFDRYLAARLEKDLSKQGVETSITLKEADLFVGKLFPKYEMEAQKVTSYTQKLLRYVKDGGLISEDLYSTLLKKYPNYVPLNRVFDDLIETGNTVLNKKSIGSLSQQTVVLGRKGSERDIVSPISSIIDKAYLAVNQVERNRVAQSIAGLRHLPQFKNIIKPTDLAKGKNTIATLIDGRKQLFEVPEGFEVAAKNLNRQQMNIIIRALALPVRFARLGYTGVNIPFVATNFVRDQLFTTITSPRSFKTSVANPYNWTRGLFDSVKGAGLYDDFLASGGGWATFFQQGRLQGRTTLKEVLQGRGERVARTIINPTKWVGAMEDLVSRFGEQPTRVQQFGGTLEALGARGLRIEPLAAPTRVQAIAAQAGRRNSTDFGIKGAYGEVLNSALIYLNAGIQGTRTAVRAVKTNPVGTGAKIAATLFAPITAATLWNIATPERKAAYEDIPEWERSTNLIILPPNPQKDKSGHFVGAVKIPLPFNFSALTIPVRKGIEHMAGIDQVKVRDLLATFLGFVSPIDIDIEDPLRSVVRRFIPTAVLPFAEEEANMKFFTGTPIVPTSKENLPPEMQTAFDTSAFMKEVGGILNYSPAKLQHLVQSYSGGVGLQVLNAIDHGMVAAGLAEPEDIGGRSILADLQRRFGKVGTGRIQDLAYQEVASFKGKAAVRSFQEKEAAENIYAQLQELPRGMWRAKLSELKREGILNENIYNRIKDLDEAEQADVSSVDKFAISLPVVERAEFILSQLEDLRPDQHRAFLSDLKQKKVLTERVFEELEKLGYRLP